MPAAAELERDLDAQLERAATRAFRDSFLIGAGLAAPRPAHRGRAPQADGPMTGIALASSRLPAVALAW